MIKRSKQRILACGPLLDEGVTGLVLAFELFVDGLERAGIDYKIVNLVYAGRIKSSGRFELGRAFQSLMIISRVWRLLPRCDIFYATMSTSTLGFIREFLNVLFARILGKRVVLHLHGGGFGLFLEAQPAPMKWLIRKHLEGVDQVVVLGELLKEQFASAGAIRDRLAVVPNGLPLGVEEPKAYEKNLPGPDRQIDLLYLSNLMPSKGYLDVIEAIRLLQAEAPGRYRLHLCGSFKTTVIDNEIIIKGQEDLERYLTELGLKESVVFHGQVSGEAKTAELSRAHVFLLPTYYPWEGQPLSIIEAQAFGTPVITTHHRGIPEQVLDGQTGIFVPPKDPAAIASAIKHICEDSETYSQMSAAARLHYERNFRRSVHQDLLLSVVLNEQREAGLA